MNDWNYQKELYKLLQRAEKAKVVTKYEIGDVLPTLGIFNTRPEEYNVLQDALIVAQIYLKRKGIHKFKLEYLPEPLRIAVAKYYARAINRSVNSFTDSRRIWFWVDLTEDRKEIIEPEKVTLEDIVYNWSEKANVLIIAVTAEGRGGSSNNMGYGKTDFAFKIAEKLLDMEQVDVIISNARLDPEDENYEKFKDKFVVINRFSELLNYIFRHRDKRKIFVFDEAAIHLMSRRASSNKNVLFLKLLVLFRKLRTNVVFTTQDLGLLDKAIRDFLDVRIVKKDLTTAEVYDSINGEIYILENIKATKIPFVTEDIAPLALDIEEKQLDELIMKLDYYLNTNIEIEKPNSAAPTISTKKKGHLEKTLMKYFVEHYEATYYDIETDLGIDRRSASYYLPKWARAGYLEKTASRPARYRLTPEGHTHFSQKIKEVV